MSDAGIVTTAAASDRRRRQLLPGLKSILFGLAWWVNAALLLGVANWVYFDGRSPPDAEGVWRSFPRLLDAASMGVRERSAITADGPPLWLLAAVAAGVVMLVGLWWGPPRFRSLRAWLLFTGLACGWLGLLVSWPNLYWAGQQHRVAQNLDAATRFAQQLSADWPTNDGQLSGIGMFLAYPKGRPTTLLMLGETPMPGTGLWFSAVERGPGGVLRFELSGAETDAWLEWRPDGSTPEAYVGGLETDYQLRRDTRLSSEWSLARYQARTLPKQ